MGHTLKAFLEPKSIALVGVSKTPNRPGSIMTENLKKFGFAGEIYPVNHEGGEILGFKMYKSIEELPEKVDLAISMVPADETIEMLNSCALKGIKNVVLVSGGFSESGQDGTKRQNELVKHAKDMGIRIMGPNAVGPVNTSNNLALHFYPLKFLKKGGIAWIAQSGQFNCCILELMNLSFHVGTSKGIDVGNCCDIDESDVLEYLEEDHETRVIAIYMESIREGKRFLEVAKRVSKKKPIIVFKTGRTEEGLRTAASHTGAMTVDDIIFDVALKQAGVIRAGDLDEFLDLAKVFDYSYIPRGNRVGVVTYSGGVGAMVADACGEFGLKLAEISKDTVEKIRPVLPPSTKVSNPLDCFAAGAPPNITDIYQVAISAFLEDANVDIVLPCFLVHSVMWDIDFEYIISELKQTRNKPLIAWMLGDEGLVTENKNNLEENGIPVFASPERAVRAIGALWKYYSRISER